MLQPCRLRFYHDFLEKSLQAAQAAQSDGSPARRERLFLVSDGMDVIFNDLSGLLGKNMDAAAVSSLIIQRYEAWQWFVMAGTKLVRSFSDVKQLGNISSSLFQAPEPGSLHSCAFSEAIVAGSQVEPFESGSGESGLLGFGFCLLSSYSPGSRFLFAWGDFGLFGPMIFWFMVGEAMPPGYGSPFWGPGKKVELSGIEAG